MLLSTYYAQNYSSIIGGSLTYNIEYFDKDATHNTVHLHYHVSHLYSNAFGYVYSAK